MQTHLHRKVEHGALAWADVRLAVIDGHLVCHQGLFLIDTQDGAMCHHAIQAVVGGTGGGDDHFTLALGQATVFTQHQGIVVSEKCPPFSRATRQGQKHIGHKTGFFLNFQDFGADVFRQVFDLRGRVAVHIVSICFDYAHPLESLHCS